jgi:PadR family transcriptional regulator PadR
MRQDIFRGHLETLVLAVLADGPRHGYAISQELAARSDGVLSYPTGSLYPAMRRLEEANLISGSWRSVTAASGGHSSAAAASGGQSGEAAASGGQGNGAGTAAGRQRRTYELTAAGRRALATDKADWRQFTAAVEAVLRLRPTDPN